VREVRRKRYELPEGLSKNDDGDDHFARNTPAILQRTLEILWHG
jgi:hypothetical protein